MRIALISNITAGIGLARDFELLRDFLVELGHEVVGIQYDDPIPNDLPQIYLSIFLEVIPRELLGLSDHRWYVANCEWLKPDRIQIVDRNCQKVFAKTREAQRILEPIFPSRVFFTGWLSRDQFDPSVKREPWFLHIGGNSSLRGTQAVVDAFTKWRKNGKLLDAKLCIVSSALKECPVQPNIFWWKNLSEADLKTLQNQCMYHIYPSQTEGYGMAVHEAFGVGATVLVTDAPPLDELDECYGLPATKGGTYGLADLYEVSALDIYEAVEEVSNIPWVKDHWEKPKTWDLEPRNYFLACNEEFKEAFAEHLETPEKKAPIVRQRKEGQKSIAFIGNFAAEHSTENQILWALENRLNFDVEKLQENTTNYREISESLKWNDALIWVKTPGWLHLDNSGMSSMVMILEECRQRKIPSISIHLDKFWSIPDREEEIGRHVFWLTDYVWTADGSRQEDFKKRGVNHFWMRPAVSEVYCHPGQPRDHYKCDVCFVGAKEYHHEYPFRKQLVEFLENEYGERFKHIQGVRGHDLNDVYASARVTVGDCIFAGIPNYWSDRLPETVGRHGFLLHPSVDGINIPVATYVAQDLSNLKTLLDSWITLDVARRKMVALGAEHVLAHDTWTIRMREILSEAGL